VIKIRIVGFCLRSSFWEMY